MNCNLYKMGISNLNFSLSLSFTLALILIGSIIVISFKIDAVDATERVPNVGTRRKNTYAKC